MKHSPEILDLSLYPKQPRHAEARTDLSPVLLHLQRYFQDSAHSAELRAHVRQRTLTEAPPPDQRVVTREDAFSHLDDSMHDADAVVLLLKSLADVGPEVGHLLMRTHHLFLVTLDPLPERKDDPDTYRGITTLPMRSKRLASGILEPVAPAEFGESACDVERSGLLSFHEMRSLERNRIRDLLHYVGMRRQA